MHTDGEIRSKKIVITFQEEDRLQARPFTEGGGCLVATALKRMGHPHVLCNVDDHFVEGFHYVSNQTDSSSLCALTYGEYKGMPDGPYYRPEVVGRQAVLTLKE